MKTTVTSKGQVTIPIRIRKRLKLDAGTVLDFDEDADHLRAAVVSGRLPIHKLIGVGKKKLAGKSSLEWLEETRGLAHPPPSRRAR